MIWLCYKKLTRGARDGTRRPHAPAARAAIDCVKPRVLAEREQAKQQEPGKGGQGRGTPELLPRTRKALNRLKARMLAERQ